MSNQKFHWFLVAGISGAGTHNSFVKGLSRNINQNDLNNFTKWMTETAKEKGVIVDTPMITNISYLGEMTTDEFSLVRR